MVVSILLQEEQSRQNRNIMRVADQAFVASHHKGKGKFKSKSVIGADGAKKPDKGEQKKEKKVRCNYYKEEKKVRCNYYKELGHVIKECPKVGRRQRKKRLVWLFADASNSNVESANVVYESE